MAVSTDLLRQYANIQGGGGGNTGEAALAGVAGGAIGAGISMIPRVSDKVANKATEVLEQTFAPLNNFITSDVKTWDTMDLSTAVPNAGTAFLQWKNSLNPRQLRIAQRRGMLNPITFKQQYDSQIALYAPAIKEKLRLYQTMNNVTSDQMKKLMKKNPMLNSFLLSTTSPEELATTFDYLTPDRTFSQFVDQKGGALGITGQLAKAGGLAGLGIGLGMQAFDRTEMGGAIDGVGPKERKAIEKAAKKAGFGETLEKRSAARKTRNVAGSKAAVTRAKNKFKTAQKNYKGKKFATTTEGKNLKSKITAAEDAVKFKKKQTTKTAGNVLDRAIKKHGKAKVIRLLAKRLGARGAAALLAKVGLAAVPGAQALSVGLLAMDVAAIYGILSDLAE